MLFMMQSCNAVGAVEVQWADPLHILCSSLRRDFANGVLQVSSGRKSSARLDVVFRPPDLDETIKANHPGLGLIQAVQTIQRETSPR